MFGYGAIFNFNAGVGEVRRAPKLMLRMRLEWLYRAFEQPKKNIPEILGIHPHPSQTHKGRAP